MSRNTGSRSAAAVIFASSRAVVWWLSDGSPLGFSKRVSVRPSSRAFAFILSTNARSPPHSSGHGCRRIVARRRAAGRRACRAASAFRLLRGTSTSLPRPRTAFFTVYTRSWSPSPSATSAVMIFVVDAIGRRLSAFSANRVSPRVRIHRDRRRRTECRRARQQRRADPQREPQLFHAHHSLAEQNLLHIEVGCARGGRIIPRRPPWVRFRQPTPFSCPKSPRRSSIPC